MIRKKILELMKLVPYLQKDGRNQEQGYSYVTAQKLLEALHPHLIELELIAIPTETLQSVNVIHVADKERALTTKEFKLRLIDTSDDTEETVTVVSQGYDPGDKGAYKASTGGVKYAWFMLLGLQMGDDPEADAATDRDAAEPPFTRTGLTPVGTASQSALSGAGIALPRQSAAPQPPGTFTVSGVKIEKTGIIQKGKKKGDPYTIWAVLTENGPKFTTFDEVLADRASGLKGQAVTIISEPNQYGGLDLKRIDPVVPF